MMRIRVRPALEPRERDKFRELVLYVVQQLSGDPNFGKTKLNKALFYSDFGAYRDLGRSITGATYIKLEHGPGAPDLPTQVGAMKRMGWLGSEPLGKNGEKLLFEREAAPNISMFTMEEKKIVDRVISWLAPMTTKEASLVSHDTYGWQAAEVNEEIDYNTALVDRARPLTEDETEWAKTTAERFLARQADPANPDPRGGIRLESDDDLREYTESRRGATRATA